MNRRTRYILIAILFCIFCGSAYMFFDQYLSYKQGEAIYEDAIDQFVINPPDPAPPIDPPDPNGDNPGTTPSEPVDNTPKTPAITMDFEKLAEINTDIIGWIIIPDTNVNYPLLKGETNDTYLRHAYNKKSNRMGSIFMDYRSKADLSDRHTIIYGHNMKNNSMFSVLLRYDDQSFYDKHRYFYIHQPTGYLKYEIFSAYMVTVPSSLYTIGFTSDAQFDPYVKQFTSDTWIASNVFPTGSDKVVTLSTCGSDSDTERFVVHGYLVEDTRGAQE